MNFILSKSGTWVLGKPHIFRDDTSNYTNTNYWRLFSKTPSKRIAYYIFNINNISARCIMASTNLQWKQK